MKHLVTLGKSTWEHYTIFLPVFLFLKWFLNEELEHLKYFLNHQQRLKLVGESLVRKSDKFWTKLFVGWWYRALLGQLVKCEWNLKIRSQYCINVNFLFSMIILWLSYTVVTQGSVIFFRKYILKEFQIKEYHVCILFSYGLEEDMYT